MSARAPIAALFFAALGSDALSLRSPNGRIKVDNDAETGTFSVSIDGETWLPAGNPVGVRNQGKLYSAGSKGDEKLVSKGDPKSGSGSDTTGAFASITQEWTAGDASFSTSARVYDSTVVFSQVFESGVTASQSGDVDGVLSYFPSFRVGNFTSSRLGYMQYNGDMVGSGYHLGEWDDKSSGIGSGIKGTGPLVVFTEDLSTSIVMSPFSHFMAANQAFSEDDRTVSYGVMGNVSSVPAGYTLETIIQVGSGVQSVMMDWGDALLSRSGKGRDDAWTRDFALQYLGYSTDNGAYYYYNTIKGKNYQDTMLAVKAYADQEGIPYRYWLADSWWYYKGPSDGVVNWTADPSIFPDGMEYVYKKTEWLVQGHNRYWSAETTYAKQNGGDWDFEIARSRDGKSDIALPVSQDFWDFLLRTAREWGLTTYEQDWLDNEYDRFPALTQNATLARDWLTQMAAAADRNGLSIQYCMTHMRHMLQSSELPAVTQARASGDYHPGENQWHQVGTTGIFAYALGVAPSKDNYWSTTYQPGNKWGNANEPYNRLQAAVITLTKGPICPSDAVNKSDKALIMKSSAMDGTLLVPSQPAARLDSAFVGEALGIDGCPVGEAWSAPSMVSGRRYTTAFAAVMGSDYKLGQVELGYDKDANLIAFEANATTSLVSMPLTLKKCEKFDFQLYNIVPRESNGWALLGEQSKWISVSPNRFLEVTSTDESLDAIVQGTPGETVTVSFADPNNKIVTVDCVFSSGRSAKASVPAKTCVSL